MSGLSPGYINSRSFHFLLHSLCPLWTKPTLSCLEGKNKGMTKAKTLFITAILSHGKLVSGTQYCVSPVKILLCHHFLGRPVWTPKSNYLWKTDQHQWQQLPSRSSQLEAIFPIEGHLTVSGSSFAFKAAWCTGERRLQHGACSWQLRGQRVGWEDWKGSRE